MGLYDRIQEMMERLREYPWWQVAVELLVIWVLCYALVRVVQGARAATPLKTLFFVLLMAALVIRIAGSRESFQRLAFLYDNFLWVMAIMLIVVFQPELRRGLMRLGERSLFGRSTKPETATVDAVTEAAVYLGRAKFGAIVVIEREVPLSGIVEGGTVLHARVSARLLQTVFFPGSALHDLAVVIKGDEVVAAGVQLPLAEESDVPDHRLGSRHRAAIGISQDTDAIVVVVSEETGIVSLAERGELTRGLNEQELRGLLVLKLNPGLVHRITKAAEEAEQHESRTKEEEVAA
ncbi:MAG: diadenylate cyclase CdaA [Phycisphaerales bacterium]